MTIERLGIDEDSFLVVKVGSDDRPATQQDIDLMKKDIEAVIKPKWPTLPVLVTHHDVELEVY